METLTSYTEGLIRGISIQEKNVQIDLLNMKREPCRINLEDVSELMVNQLNTQNIIDRVTVWEFKDDLSGCLNFIKIMLCGDLNVTNEPSQLLISKVSDQIKHENKKLIVFEPIYGAYIICLCSRFNIIDDC